MSLWPMGISTYKDILTRVASFTFQCGLITHDWQRAEDLPVMAPTVVPSVVLLPRLNLWRAGSS